MIKLSKQPLLTTTFWIIAFASLTAPIAARLFSGPAIVEAVGGAETNAAPGKEASDLGPGREVKSSIAGGASDRYRIAVQSGTFVALRIKKQDLNLTVTVHTSSSKIWSEFISRRYGALPLSFIAEESGDYVIDVQSLEENAEPREYSLEVTDVRMASAVDRCLDDAVRSFALGETLAARWEKEGLREALARYLKAAADWRESGRYAEAALAFERGGDVSFTLSDYPAASRAYDEARMAAIRCGDTARTAAALNGIGYVLIYEGENRKALPYFERALKLAAKHQKTLPVEGKRLTAQALNNIGEVYYSLSDPGKTLEKFNSALALWKETGDRQGQALTELNLGFLHSDLGNMKDSLSHFANAIQLFRDVRCRWGEAQVIAAIGQVNSLRGRKQQALDSYNRAVEMSRAVGDRRGEAAALNSLGDVYEALNDPASALQNYDLALKRYREIGDRDYEALSLFYLGRAHRRKDDTVIAADYFKQSLEISRRVGDRRIEIYTLKELAAMYFDLHKGREALRTYGKLLTRYKVIRDKRGQAYSLLEIGKVKEDLKKTDEAVGCFRIALSLSESAEDIAGQTSILYSIAHAEQGRQSFDKARAAIEKSLRLIESTRKEVLSKDRRADYFASVYKHYSLYVDLLMQMNQQRPSRELIAAAVEASEKARGRALLDVLMEAQQIEDEHSVDEALNQGGESQTIGGSEREKTGNTDGEPYTAPMEDRATAMEPPGRGSLSTAQSQPLTLDAIQGELKDDTLLLQFFLGKDRSYVWAVTRTTATGHELPSRERIEEEARKYYSLLTAREPIPGETASQSRHRVEEADGLLSRQAALLSQMLLGPVSAELDRRRLLIAPDGVLYFVPFDTLPKPEDARDSGAHQRLAPLLFNHEIVVEPSMSILAAIRRERGTKASAPKTVAILADPVFDPNDRRVFSHVEAADNSSDSTEQAKASNEARGPAQSANQALPRLRSSGLEAKYIAEMAGQGEFLVASGFDANLKVATGNNLALYRIVHFATHGTINTENPALSGIVLSLIDEKGDEQKGFLGLYDIYNLHLNADLAVLSACRTALGKEVKGEGLIGLTRGFMYAGSRSVLASLWQVDDEATAELMKQFYNELLRNRESPAAALKLAKEAIMKHHNWNSPYYWSGFVLQGEYDCTIGANGKASMPGGQYGPIAVAGAIVLCAIMFFITRLKRTKRLI